MKYQHLERRRMTLEIVSPVFIGSSSQEKLSKKECILLQNERMVLIPDLDKLITLLSEKGSLDAFEQYLINDNDRRLLKEFLQEQSILVSADAPWILYHLRCSSSDIRNVNTLSRFIKDRQGQPYIPGASIKGAIRTALLAQKSSENEIRNIERVTKRDIENGKKNNRNCPTAEYPLRTLKLYKKEGKETDAVNDLLRSLQISDSAPFGDDSLIVCKKLELTKDGKVNGVSSEGFRGKSSPPLYRECLRPGLKTHFYVTIDKSLAKDQLSMEIIEKALKQWMRVQYEYDDRFDQWDVDLKGLQPKNIPIILGGGVGFQSKSLLMKLKENRDDTIHSVLRFQFRNSYKNRPDDPAPYRMKLAQYNGGFWPMGRCSITVEE